MTAQARGSGAVDSVAQALSRHRHFSHSKGVSTPASHDLPDLASGSYKTLKEAWIADQTGSSIHRVNLLGLVMLTTYALWAILRSKRLEYAQTRDDPRSSRPGNVPIARLLESLAKISDWQLEFAVLIVPAIAAQTILSSSLLALNALLIVLIAVIHRTSRAPLPQEKDSSSSPVHQQSHWSTKFISETEQIQDTQPTQRRPPIEIQTDLPFRVSIDSAADAAHAAAAPPTYYDDAGPNPANGDDRASASNSDQSSSPSTSLDTPVSTHSKREPFQALPKASFRPSRDNRPPVLHLSHSRDPSESYSVISSSSPMSPLARSVVDPYSKLNRSDIDHTPAPPSPADTYKPAPVSKMDNTLFVRPQPFLTVYRAHMMLVTVIAILAVDFPVFPRAFSKCETWGTSWMDMGVGSFVFSLGIISALPFLRSPTNRFTPFRRQLLSDFRKSLPLILLGSVRVIMVKGVEYPEHVTEYGVHWNFFITLAILPFAATLSRPFSRWIRYSLLGLGLSGLHQLLLNHTWWQDWAISTIPRQSLAEQNKEGLTSLSGYLAIFYLGLDLGHYVLPLDPYFAYRKLRSRRLKPKTDKLAMVLASLSILWWSGYGIARLVGLQTSRRLANLPYVLWVTAFNTSFLLCYVLIYYYILQPVEYAMPKFTSKKQGAQESCPPKWSTDAVTPKILSDLNRHSLTVFLVANLLTGLVNISIHTMYTNDWLAFLIVTVYTGACCATATLLTSKNIRLKL